VASESNEAVARDRTPQPGHGWRDCPTDDGDAGGRARRHRRSSRRSNTTATSPTTPRSPSSTASQPGARGRDLVGRGSTSCAFWGELFSAAAIGRGAAGVVCDGYVRDSNEGAGARLPRVRAGTRPIDFRARMEITGADETGPVRRRARQSRRPRARGRRWRRRRPRRRRGEATDALQRARDARDDRPGGAAGGATLRSVWNRYRRTVKRGYR
jgi:hypothetical protein